MPKDSRKKKDSKRKNQSTRLLIGITTLTDHGVKTEDGELVFLLVKPTNLSVLSDENVAARVYALTTVLKSHTEAEILCMNSRENFEQNKAYLRSRQEQEDNPAIRRLLEQDAEYLDRIQIQMATAREFVILVRLKDEKDAELLSYLSRAEKNLKEQGFTVRRADRSDVKRLLGVYYEQNVTTEQFEDVDGQRWADPNGIQHKIL